MEAREILFSQMELLKVRDAFHLFFDNINSCFPSEIIVLKNCNVQRLVYTIKVFVITVGILKDLQKVFWELTQCRSFSPFSLKHFLQILQNTEFTYAKFLL